MIGPYGQRRLTGFLEIAFCGIDSPKLGVLTTKPGKLTNDFFVNLLDMKTVWEKSKSDSNIYEGRDRESGELRWTTSGVDLLFGSDSQLRALSEVYASSDGEEKLVQDFGKVWTKIMNLDRPELLGIAQASKQTRQTVEKINDKLEQGPDALQND